jgi:hypothetical protein
MMAENNQIVSVMIWGGIFPTSRNGELGSYQEGRT